MKTTHQTFSRFSKLARGELLPCAFVDLDAVDANVEAIRGALGASNKTLRIATKSIRCPDLVRHITAKLGQVARGLMTYTARETAFWASAGETDLVLAYPTVDASDAKILAEINRTGATAAVVVDCPEHLAPLAEAARAAATTIPLIIEIDLAFRPLGSLVHLGVRRSPLRDPDAVVALAKIIAATKGLKFQGIMGYEAQIAGVSDSDFTARIMKARSRADVARVRRNMVAALVDANLEPLVVNGGGSGSLRSSVAEACLTEVTAGSGFLDSHLFDAYASLTLTPAIFFALQITRRAASDIVVCQGGGFIASGKSGVDRLPIPWLPEGLSLLPLEGAGEVQTPIHVKNGSNGDHPLQIGDPIFFRHAKAGELAEHFNEYLLVRADRIDARAKTYRGLGHAFLG